MTIRPVGKRKKMSLISNSSRCTQSPIIIIIIHIRQAELIVSTIVVIGFLCQWMVGASRTNPTSHIRIYLLNSVPRSSSESTCCYEGVYIRENSPFIAGLLCSCANSKQNTPGIITVAGMAEVSSTPATYNERCKDMPSYQCTQRYLSRKRLRAKQKIAVCRRGEQTSLCPLHCL